MPSTAPVKDIEFGYSAGSEWFRIKDHPTLSAWHVKHPPTEYRPEFEIEMAIPDNDAAMTWTNMPNAVTAFLGSAGRYERWVDARLRPRVPVVDVNVRTTDGSDFNFDQYFVGAELGNLDVLDFRPSFRFGLYDGKHCVCHV